MTAVLRPWTPEDAPALAAALRADADLQSQFRGIESFTVPEAREHIHTHLSSTASSRIWAVDVDRVAVGSVGLSGIERRHGTAWAYYWLTSSVRGRGLASRGLAAVSSMAFEDGLFRLELGHRLNNPASCAVAVRAGFIAEGIERQKLRYGSERFDVETHARLRTDPRPDLEPLPMVGSHS